MKKSKESRCQCCNKTLTSEFHLVFGDEGKRQNIAALLFDYIKKSLDESDGLRYAICDPCWHQLIQYNEFQKECIRANELSSDDDDDDTNQTETTQIPAQIDSIDNGSFDTMQNDLLYEGNEYLNETQNENTYEYEELDDMKVEYLEENDNFDDEHFCDQDSQIDKKKLPFDFTAVLVKPFFVLGIGNFILFENVVPSTKKKLQTNYNLISFRKCR